MNLKTLFESKFEGIIYRGVGKSTPVDEGLYGKGTYFTNDKKYAKQYGNSLIQAKVLLRKPFRTSMYKIDDIIKNWTEENYKKVINRQLPYADYLEEKSKKITEKLKSKGYDGVVLSTGKYKEIVVFNIKKSLSNVKKMNEILEQRNLEKEMDSEDLESCDVYPLPDWWDNDNIILKPIKEINELNFPNEEEFHKYANKHNIRKSTKVTVAGKETTAGELQFKNKKKSKSRNTKNPFIKKYGKLNLNAYPPIGMKEEDVEINLKGNINNHTVMKWKDPKSGRTVNAYTQKFLEKNAKIKWKRVKKFNENTIQFVHKKSIQELKSKDKKIRDAAAVTAIIVKTGLRPGSHTGLKDTGNKGILTLEKHNIKIEGDKIILNFVGKHYIHNNAEFRDKHLAEYLSKKIEKKKDSDFIFDITKSQLITIFKNKLGKKEMLIKDLRTYTATKMATQILIKNKMPPPPLAENERQIKREVKAKLKIVYEEVSQKLNNTPAMAKNNYIHPQVIKKWLKKLGVEPTLVGVK